jgi:hypothetical protein
MKTVKLNGNDFCCYFISRTFHPSSFFFHRAVGELNVHSLISLKPIKLISNLKEVDELHNTTTITTLYYEGFFAVYRDFSAFAY